MKRIKREKNQNKENERQKKPKQRKRKPEKAKSKEMNGKPPKNKAAWKLSIKKNGKFLTKPNENRQNRSDTPAKSLSQAFKSSSMIWPMYEL